MAVLYIISEEEGAGKTLVCAGLGKYLQGSGRKVGFIKALRGSVDGDAAFMKRVLDLPEGTDSLEVPGDDVNRVREACEKVSQGRDVVIVEGMLGQNAGETARALGARVIIVEPYSGQEARSIEGYKGFGDSLLGVVVNKVPASRLERAREEVSARFSKAGIGFLGVLPEDRVLFAVTVGELAEGVQGRMLNNTDKSAELVENFMLGAMVVDSGLDYFGRKSRKAAIVRQDRPDMALAALETPTSCLVLVGSKEPPVYNVSDKAKNRGIPIISTGITAVEVIGGIEDTLNNGKIHQEKKLPKINEIIKQLDLKAVL